MAGADLARRVQTAISAAGNARFTINEDGTTGSGVLDFTKAGLRASIALKDGRDNIKAVVLPGVLYINSGEVVQRKHWIKLAGTLHAKTLKTAQAQILGGIAVVSPAVQATSWRSAGDFTTGATTTIGGVPATRYDGTVPKAAFIAAFPVQARSAMRLTGDTRVSVWLDARNRPARMEVVTAFSDGDETDTTTFSAWGAAPAIRLPARSDTLSGRF